MRRHDRSVTETGLALVQQRSVEGIKGRLSRKQAFTKPVSTPNVRFGSKADIGASVKDVRFTAKSGHNAERKNPSVHRPSSGVAVVRSESECRIENSPARRRVLGHA